MERSRASDKAFLQVRGHTVQAALLALLSFKERRPGPLVVFAGLPGWLPCLFWLGHPTGPPGPGHADVSMHPQQLQPVLSFTSPPAN